jgi:hypothetical protein
MSEKGAGRQPQAKIDMPERKIYNQPFYAMVIPLVPR